MHYRVQIVQTLMQLYVLNYEEKNCLALSKCIYPTFFFLLLKSLLFLTYELCNSGQRYTARYRAGHVDRVSGFAGPLGLCEVVPPPLLSAVVIFQRSERLEEANVCHVWQRRSMAHWNVRARQRRERGENR